MNSDRLEWLGSLAAWRRFAAVAYGAFILGGVLAVPLTTILAVISSMLPGHALLHQFGGAFYGYGALWFMAALCAAHFRRTQSDKEPAR
ncbi:MAG TPA: hypothetical protein VGN32_07780 [Ktedonobacterales bacterium]|nr:hypothetical protein [Ktedonobacterales bacterium]